MEQFTAVAKQHEIPDLGTLLPGISSTTQAAIRDYLQQVITDFGNEVVAIMLYGSYARGVATAESDIDLFILIRQESPTLCDELANLAWQVQFDHDVVISDVIYSVEQYQRMQSRLFPFYQNLKRDGILLWKNKSEPMLNYA
ncbi:MAG: nucleotidyltransferase domain-containing protein [Anaerolinea sp.]|nr:nucleotidyltransferase domain-containing protein [Anaerolinea sp.]